ncbi:MAG: PilZ domain-containing protein [Candidatus Solibacter usitatus]|nr:PilZ domain-containing protein [Candidatus Solibacter usitatus]
MRLPVELTRAGSRLLSSKGETLNVSSGGVLISEPAEPLEIGQPIEYLISLPTGKTIGEIRLRCMGKVVRRNHGQNAFAATLERYEFVRSSAAGR